MQINDNVQKLLEKRYFLRDNNGELIEHSWSDIAKRVADNIAQAENKKDVSNYAEIFYQKISEMEFIPSSPCIFNAGTSSQSLSSCFVVDIEDNIEGIFQTVAECAKIFQMSGGAGFSMRKIRPNGSSCKSSGSKASGVVSFMYIFNEVVNRVKQGNKRNGAIKIDLPCDHPEIFDFIHSKDNVNELTNMNISVSVTDDFIVAVENDKNWELKFNGKVYQTIKAADLWNDIMLCAWKTGEPGLSYQTNMDNGNMNPHINKEVFGNPCHEYVNVPYSSCNLASINLTRIIEDGKINWSKLEENIKLTFRFLDNMITMNKLPLPKIEAMTKSIRPIGLGTMGFAQLLYALKIPYDSQECLDFIDKLYGFIDETALKYNIKLATERGVYPAWQGSKWEEKKFEVRCSSMTSIAPNGSIAFIANTTGGIEPQFALVYKRVDNDNDEYMIADSIFENYLKANNLYTEEILYRINNNKGSIKGLDDIFTKEIQNIFVTANDISPEWHVKVLAQIQKYVSLSISKTVNLPNNATVEDVGNVYLLAGKNGIKGITVYRDGCREHQILSTGNNKDVKIKSNQEFLLPWGTTIEASDDMIGHKCKLMTGCGSLHLQTWFDPSNGKLMEIFLSKGSTGGCNSFMVGLSRTISLALRSGVSFDYAVDQLKSVPACPSYVSRNATKKDCSPGNCCPSAIANALIKMQEDVFNDLGIEEENKVIIPVKTVKIETNKIKDEKLTQNELDYIKQNGEIEFAKQFGKCPVCGERLLHIEGCLTSACGWSKCG